MPMKLITQPANGTCGKHWCTSVNEMHTFTVDHDLNLNFCFFKSLVRVTFDYTFLWLFSELNWLNVYLVDGTNCPLASVHQLLLWLPWENLCCCQYILQETACVVK